ncbi:hypothetical protein [Olleya aquimaris]|uniref:Uncharacterized protein n=1 Tax=Olleya aquimaris TaxID=639310 RepID=A0A327R7F9_9FLAO|nr:hypothetical protein [Olleya aquimaris]RAJ12095.1 hypothetical protein LY08_02347 [Olleya aquimaris]
MGLITAPSIIVAIDDTIDISIFYSISEEEEEIKNLKLFPSLLDVEYNISDRLNYNQNLGYHYKTYPKPHLNIISPPPEFI